MYDRYYNYPYFIGEEDKDSGNLSKVALLGYGKGKIRTQMSINHGCSQEKEYLYEYK